MSDKNAMVERKCKCCGNRFMARKADVDRGWARFCSKSCKATQQTRKTGVGRGGKMLGYQGGFDGGNFDNTEHQDHER